MNRVSEIPEKHQSEPDTPSKSTFQEIRGIYRYESLFGRLVKVLDSSGHTKESTASSAPDIRKFWLKDIFPEGSVFLGFGRPNVFLGLPREKSGFDKFDAKSIKRADSKIINTRGWAQSGILIQLNISQDVIEILRKEAQKQVGTRSWTCVNANCRVLDTAGFTSNGTSLKDFYFPMDLARQIIRSGLEFEGNRVEIKIIKTTSKYLENFGLSVVKSQFLTLCRHANRNLSGTLRRKLKKYGINTKVKSNQSGKYKEHVNESTVNKSEKQLNLETFRQKMKTEIIFSISEPSFLGAILRTVWGAHSLFQIKVLRTDIDKYLPVKLKEFDLLNLSLLTKIKKNIIFCPLVVNIIRSHLMRSNLIIENPTQAEIMEMLRTFSPEQPVKYNIVITGEAIGIVKLNVKYPFIDWILSKHILTSGYSSDVRFAGELWKGQDSVIYLNNNSGTYRPTNELLAQAVAYLGVTFPNTEFFVMTK